MLCLRPALAFLLVSINTHKNVKYIMEKIMGNVLKVSKLS